MDDLSNEKIKKDTNKKCGDLQYSYSELTYDFIEKKVKEFNNDAFKIESFIKGLYTDLFLGDMEWFRSSFDELYILFDNQRQLFNECFELRRKREIDIIINHSNVNRIKNATIIELGVGYGRVAKKILERFPKVKIKGIDLSKVLLNEARNILSKYKKQVDLFDCDMRDIENLGLDGTADLVLFIYTTFGYFNDYWNKKVLQNACDLLKPGGTLIIEQYNPYLYVYRNFNMDVYEENYRNREKILLLKTTNYEKENDYSTRYWGKYYYFVIDESNNNRVLIPFKYHNYSICLYFEDWFFNALEEFEKHDLKVNFDWIFDNELYTYKKKAQLMIITISKQQK